MLIRAFTFIACLAASLAVPSQAHAATEQLEFWFDQTVSKKVDKTTKITLETGQRFRDIEAQRFDSVFGRAWFTRKLDKNFKASVAVEYRVNGTAPDEVRLTQQIKAKNGILRAGLRFEQRWLPETDRVGLRARPKLGVEFPLDKDKKWNAVVDGEAFFDLRVAQPKLDTGLTTVKTRVGVAHQLSKRVELRAHYLRKQVFKPNYPDKVSHAPQISLNITL